ncbi:MAG: hypothetical protein M1816_003224 [Peltula sp. TS41687]|nr:MAG: hypothetical protein M1816_003224 [Peltula sp. TS41687]
MKLSQLQQSFTLLSLPLLLSPIPGASALPILGGISPMNNGLLRMPMLADPMAHDSIGSMERLLSSVAPAYRARIMQYFQKMLSRPSYINMNLDRTSDDNTLARRDLSDDWDAEDGEQSIPGETNSALVKRDSQQLTHHLEKRQWFHVFNMGLMAMQFLPYLKEMSKAMTWGSFMKLDNYLAEWHPDWRKAYYQIDTFGNSVPYEQWKARINTEKDQAGMTNYDETVDLHDTWAKKFKDYVVREHQIPPFELFAAMPKELNKMDIFNSGMQLVAKEPNGPQLIEEARLSQGQAIAELHQALDKAKAMSAAAGGSKGANLPPGAKNMTPAQRKALLKDEDLLPVGEEGGPTVAASAKTPARKNQPNTAAADAMPNFAFADKPAFKVKPGGVPAGGTGGLLGVTLPKSPLP